MKYFKLHILSILVLAVALFSCEKDDICAESTETTPHLIIDFYDITTPDEEKNVRLLTVTGEGLTNPILFSTTTSTISIPLRFQEEGEITTSRFELKKDTDYDNDDPDVLESNTDIIEVTYTPEFIYVSRACGYKSIFNDTQIAIEADADNWAISFEVINSTIDNENEAHINIYH